MPESRSYPQRAVLVLLALLVVGVWGLLLRSFLLLGRAEAKTAPGARSATLDTLTVQRINVVDANGKTRFVIANSDHFPGLIARGKAQAQRSIHAAAGVVFYDENGDEAGGLVLAKLRDENIANMTFDYVYQPTDGVYVIRRESADGAHWQAGFGISDRRPFQPGQIESSQGVPRIALIDKDRNAQLVISDVQGHPRIRIGVDATGEPQIQTLNADGKVVYSAENR
ncbi:MAG: hypothetical protein JO111_14640 [Caulobacteraceae bacterium]|nr:hypothetical protein [Caulobacteraceae bacterium]